MIPSRRHYPRAEFPDSGSSRTILAESGCTAKARIFAIANLNQPFLALLYIVSMITNSPLEREAQIDHLKSRPIDQRLAELRLIERKAF